MNNGPGTRMCSPTEDSPLDLTFIDIKFANLATWVVHDDEWGSDHYPIFTLSRYFPLYMNKLVFNVGNLAKARWGRFTHLCTENISNIDDVDIDKFHDSIISSIKKSASLSIPLTSNTNGRDPLPFWNKQCQNACNQKSALNKKYKSTKQPNIQVGNTKYATNKEKANIVASRFAKVSSEENSSREFLGLKTKYEQENETCI